MINIRGILVYLQLRKSVKTWIFFPQCSLSNLQNELNSLDSIKSVHEISILTKVLKVNMDIYFNDIIDSSSFPNLLKLSNITLFHKKDSRNDKRNYRPVRVYYQTYQKFSKMSWKSRSLRTFKIFFTDNKLVSAEVSMLSVSYAWEI